MATVHFTKNGASVEYDHLGNLLDSEIKEGEENIKPPILAFQVGDTVTVNPGKKGEWVGEIQEATCTVTVGHGIQHIRYLVSADKGEAWVREIDIQDN